MKGKLILKDGSVYEGNNFGFEKPVAGEVVFTTGMVGYPESLTDPSYLGQIVICTYPLIGNYGVPKRDQWESEGIKVSGLIVSNYIDTPSHSQSIQTLSEWLKNEKIPALEIPDTRQLTQKIRQHGTILGQISFVEKIPFKDPNDNNLVSLVSTKNVEENGTGNKTILLIDCGAKKNIKRCLIKRGVKLITVPWNFDPFDKNVKCDAIVISNGPGDPKRVVETIKTVEKAVKKKIPILGICLGNQILALATGGDTYKLKYGHRSQNQPCKQMDTNRCFLTTQNHGFAINKIPLGFKPWFKNANDNTNEGIIHETLPFMSVQFHPEACPGPVDTEWIFDYFLNKVKAI